MHLYIYGNRYIARSSISTGYGVSLGSMFGQLIIWSSNNQTDVEYLRPNSCFPQVLNMLYCKPLGAIDSSFICLEAICVDWVRSIVI